MEIIVFYTVIIGYLGITMFLANQEERIQDRQPGLRLMLVLAAIILAYLGLSAFLQSIASPPDPGLANSTDQPEFIEISFASGILGLLLGGGAAFFIVALLRSEEFRARVDGVFQPRGSFQTNSMVHITAVVLVLLLVVGNIILFITSGGTEAVAESIEEGGNDVGAPIFQALVQVLAALIGIGFLTRRTWKESMMRLGLRFPTQEDILYGFGGAIFLYGVLIVFGGIVSLFFSADQLDQQSEAADALVQSFATVPLALILSASAAVGEEVLFRGALQPVFGILLTSAIFVLMHSQVLGSPVGLMVLIIVAIGLGWLRDRYTTTTAIIAHFIYNFTILSLAMLGTSSGAT